MNKIKITTDTVQVENTKKDLTLIHISDIHFNINTKIEKLDKIRNKIYQLKPDYIVITGDLIDEPTITKNKQKIKKLLLFLTSLGNIAKVFISLGNHDIFATGDFTFFKNLDELKNIYILNDNFYQDESIYISGLTLPTNYYYNLLHEESKERFLEHLHENRKLIEKVPKNIPKVVLIHSPIRLTDEEILKKLKNYDLILSGHTHDGMVPNFLTPIFKNNGIIAPNKKLFPKNIRGKLEREIDFKKITIIISGGITKLSERSSKILSKLNFFYDISINKIIITKKRGFK